MPLHNIIFSENPKNRKEILPHYKVEATSLDLSLNIRELWAYRELLYFLMWRDIKVRYKQTLIGASWAIIQPFVTMVVFSIFFGNLGHVNTNGIPYPIFSYAALVPWSFFSNALGLASDSIVGNGQLIRKLYFPRILLPLGRVLSGVVDFILAFIVLIAMMFFYRLFPSFSSLILIPLLCVLLFILILGVSLWFSSINTRYRDVRYIIPFVLQIWMFITPIIYSTSQVPEGLRPFYALNPMVSVIEGFRMALLREGTVTLFMLLISFFVAFTVLITGIVFFQRTQSKFADIV